MKANLAALPLAAGTLFFAGTVAAQSAPAAPAPPPLWAGKGEVSFVSTTGNTDVQTLGAGFELHYRPLPWSADLTAGYVRSDTSGVSTAESLAGALRASRKIAPRLQAFVQGDYLRNTFAGIDRRLSGAGGLAFDALTSTRQTLVFRAGLGYTKENRVEGADRSFGNALAGLSYKYSLTKTTDLTDELAYTRDLKDAADWRLANALAISVAIDKTFSLKASHELQYLNEPVPGFGKTDTITKLALVAAF